MLTRFNCPAILLNDDLYSGDVLLVFMFKVKQGIQLILEVAFAAVFVLRFLKAVKFTQTRIGKTRMRVSLSFCGSKVHLHWVESHPKITCS